jgi:ATP-binding cassette subfamily B protein
MISRIAKKLPRFTNIIIQRTGGKCIRKVSSIAIAFQDFEDQRSGETLGRLQK